MFDKWFAVNNKKENKPSIDGVAHIDGSFEDSRLPNDSQEVQDKIDFIDDNKKKKDLGDKADSEDKDRSELRGKVSNERRKEGINDRNSNWKEKAIFGEPLSKEEISDEHLDALMQQEENTKFVRDNFYPEEYDEDEDIDLEKAA